jgi:hypothetical protein
VREEVLEGEEGEEAVAEGEADAETEGWAGEVEMRVTLFD